MQIYSQREKNLYKKKNQWIWQKKIKKWRKLKNIIWIEIPSNHKTFFEDKRLYYFTDDPGKKSHQKKSIAVDKLGSIFHVSLKNLSGYILVHKKRICCLDFGG